MLRLEKIITHILWIIKNSSNGDSVASMTVPASVSAVFSYIEIHFAPESMKKPLLSGRQKRFFTWCEGGDLNPYERNAH